MLRIDNEASDDESDTAINKSTTTTPKKIDPNEHGVGGGVGGGNGNVVGNMNPQPIHINNVNNSMIGNAGQTPLQALPKVLPNMNPYTHYN